MIFGSVCSGIEAASVAWAPLGWKAAWLAEIEPFPCAVLAHHYPTVPNLGDMTTIAKRVLTGEVEAPDLLCGGTPCQAFSVAGLRESLDDARGNLTLKFVELADAIDHVRVREGHPPAIIFWENVPGVLSTKDNAFGCFLAGLAGEDEPLQPPGGRWANAGAVFGPARAIAWRTLDAQYTGLALRRRRVFIVASARAGFDPARVLFEWEGVRRDTAPSRQQGQGATHPTSPCLTSSGRGLDRAGDGRGQDPVVAVAFGGNNTAGPIDVGTALNACASASGRMDFESETFITHSLRGEGFDASEDGTGRGTPLVPVAFDTTQITSAANRCNPQAGDPCHPLAAGAHPPAIAFPEYLSGTQCATTEDLAPSMVALNPTAVAVQASQSGVRFNETIGTLDANYGSRRHNGAMAAMQVRRLTPTECERLQGFPDGYTNVPYRNKPAADGPRYKALGNSWAVPCARWIGQRIQNQLERA